MAYALVGAVGAVTTGTLNNAITPAWGTGANRTAGDLLICWCYQTSGSSPVTVPTGWTAAIQPAVAEGVSIFYKIAAGADAAPTVPGRSGAVLSGQLAEFSGNTATPLDQSGVNTAAAVSVVATFGAADAHTGELVCCGGWADYSASPTANITLTSNNISSMVAAGSNNGTATTPHWAFGYGFPTTSNAAATTVTSTSSVSSGITGIGAAGASFTLPFAGKSNFLLVF